MKTILTKKSFFAVILCTGVLFASTSTQAEIYKWKDANGVTHYSAQKPSQKKVKAENIEQKIRMAAGKPSSSSQEKNRATKKPNQTEDNSAKNKKETQLAGPSVKLVTYCKTQRKNLAQLKENFRNIWKDKDGKTTRLNQKQRQDKVNEIQESITSECAGV